MSNPSPPKNKNKKRQERDQSQAETPRCCHKLLDKHTPYDSSELEVHLLAQFFEQACRRRKVRFTGTRYKGQDKCPVWHTQTRNKTKIIQSSAPYKLMSKFKTLAPTKAYPSEIAVFPTPGSPIRTGLFFVLLERIWMHLRISSSLPITGSSFPAFAMAVKSFPYFSSASYFPSGSVTNSMCYSLKH